MPRRPPRAYAPDTIARQLADERPIVNDLPEADIAAILDAYLRAQQRLRHPTWQLAPHDPWRQPASTPTRARRRR